MSWGLYMKRIVTIFLASILVISLAGCGKKSLTEEERNAILQNLMLIGKWTDEYETEGSLELLPDGTAEFTYDEDNIQVNWYAEDGVLYIGLNDEWMGIDYFFMDNDHLVLSDGGDESVMVRDGHEEKTGSTSPFQAGVKSRSTTQYIQNLPGSWYGPGDTYPAFTLYDDGTCEIAGEYGLGTWNVVNNNIFRLSNMWSETETATIKSLENGVLVLTDGEYESFFYNTPQ